MYPGGMSSLLSPANRFQRRRERNRAAMLDAAIELFQRRGIRGTKIEEICERADVAPRTFFNHFETREHLYQEIAQQRAAQFAVLFDATTADPRSLHERLPELFGTDRRLSRRAAALSRAGGRDAPRARRGRQRGGAHRSARAGRAAIRRERRRARRDPANVRPEVLADLLLGALTTALGNWSASRPTTCGASCARRLLRCCCSSPRRTARRSTRKELP